ncbi:hypothetical protein [Aureimonas leprariae]|uniref:hypothetical protein n=1 Tax=Plantimonas leprariae TaxID=2615207 RepID=UPI00138729E4|nr:hypothetical protein [Aureimonas leprariae]
MTERDRLLRQMAETLPRLDALRRQAGRADQTYLDHLAAVEEACRCAKAELERST